MRFLALALGLALGFLSGYAGDVLRNVLCALVTVALFFWAKHKGEWLFYLIGAAIGVILGLVFSLLPYPQGTYVEGFVVKRGESYVVLQSGLWRYYVSQKDHGLEVGDYLRVEGKCVDLSFAHYESRFDFAVYLRDFGARKEIASPRVSVYFATPMRIRNFEERYLSHFQGDAKALVDSLLFGKKDYQAPSIALAEEMNLLFILSSSGLFYGAFLGLIERAVAAKSKAASKVVALCFGAVFLPFCYHKIGILRAFLMRLTHLVDHVAFQDRLTYLNRLGLTMILLLGLDLHNALNSGLWLGFGISLLLYLCSWVSKSKSKLASKAKSMGLIRAFLVPVSLYQGGALHLFAPLFTLVLAPISIALLLLGYLGLFALPLAPAVDGVSQAVLYLLERFQAFDVSFPVPGDGLIVAFSYYLAMFLCLLLVESGRARLGRGAAYAFVALYCVSLVPIVPALTQSVSFIDVGQGDCCLIQDGSTNVLIDTGGIIGFDIATESLIPYFHKRRIYHLDAIIASHQDYDHVGGVESLQRRFSVGRYVTEKSDFPLTVGSLRFANYNDYPSDDENGKSLVLSLDFLDRVFLFTGDAPKEVERKIVRDYPSLDCDVLKVGHHGSDTSTCAEFLDLITPSLAVISCGEKNKFGHPKPSVLALLKERNIPVRRTDLEGTIVLSRLKPFWE